MADDDQLMRDRVAALLHSELGEFAEATWQAEQLAEHFGRERPSEDPHSELPRAFQAAGLLDAEEAVRWQSLLAAAKRPSPPPALTPELHGAIDAYLEELIDKARDPADESDAWDRVEDAWDDLGDLGLIDEAETERWRSRRGAGLELDGGERPRGASTRRRISDLPFRTIAGPQERRCGVRVIAFDLFETDVAIRVVVTRQGRDDAGGFQALPDEIEPESPFGPRWTDDVALQDDLGTRYRIRPGSGYLDRTVDGPLRCRRELSATPAVPLAASRLTFVWAGISFEVVL